MLGAYQVIVRVEVFELSGALHRCFTILPTVDLCNKSIHTQPTESFRSDAM